MLEAACRLFLNESDNEALTEFLNVRLENVLGSVLCKFYKYYNMTVDEAPMEFAETLIDIFPPGYLKENMARVFKGLYSAVIDEEYVKLSIIMKCVLWQVIREKKLALMYKNGSTCIGPVPVRIKAALISNCRDVAYLYKGDLSTIRAAVKKVADWKEYNDFLFENEKFMSIYELPEDKNVDWTYKGLLDTVCESIFQEEEVLNKFFEYVSTL